MRALLVVSLVVGCRYNGAFVCESDTECRSRGSVGRCELATGFCLFNDDTCPTGFRYDETAGDGLASTCLGDPVPEDGGVDDTIDANTFDPAMCPAQYTGMLTGFPNARYVQMGNGSGQLFAAQIARCEPPASGPKITHAVVVDSPEKAAALVTFIGNTSRVFVGLVQSPAAVTVDGGWLGFTGEPAVAALWESGDPNDEDSLESDHAEQVGSFSPAGLSDVPRTNSYPIVCECDGRATSATALEYASQP